MEPSNPNSPTPNQASPQDSDGQEMPQPLNTSVQIPTEMPLGGSTPPPPPPPQNVGLPPELPNSPQVSKPPGKSGMLMIMGIIAVILIILGVGGYYFYTNIGFGKTSGGSDTKTTQELKGLEGELDSVEVTFPEKDLTDVDSEITQLEATSSSK